MSDDTQVVDEHSSDEVDPVAEPADGESTDEQQQVFERSVVEKLRREAASYRRKLRDLEQYKQEQEEAKLSEIDRLKKQIADRESALQERDEMLRETMFRSGVYAQAASLDVVDAEVVYKLLDRSAFEQDESGRFVGLKDAVKGLLKERPYLKKRVDVSGSVANGASGRDKSSKKESDAERRQRIWGGGASIFDAEQARRTGGGVIFKKGD